MLFTSSIALASQVRRDDRGVPQHLLRRPLGDGLAEVQHEDAVRDADDGVHVVLDHQYGDAGVPNRADQRHRADDLRRLQAAHDLVETDDLRLGGASAAASAATDVRARISRTRRSASAPRRFPAPKYAATATFPATVMARNGRTI